jgi:hypothetical protein
VRDSNERLKFGPSLTASQLERLQAGDQIMSLYKRHLLIVDLTMIIIVRNDRGKILRQHWPLAGCTPNIRKEKE